MLANKRKVSETSPETSSASSKSQRLLDLQETQSEELANMMSADDLKDFMSKLMDEKLQNLATKNDISAIGVQLKKLEMDNAATNEKLAMVEKRCQLLERKLEMLSVVSKEKNIIFTIPTHQFPEADKTTHISNLCNTLLETEAQLAPAKKIYEGNSFSKYLLQLNSKEDVYKALMNAKKLKGSKIYVQKDYTKYEQNKRNLLMRYRKCIRNFDKNIKPQVRGIKLHVNSLTFAVNEENILVCGDRDGVAVLHQNFTGINLDITTSRSRPSDVRKINSETSYQNRQAAGTNHMQTPSQSATSSRDEHPQMLN